jgi:hypothetical protein
MALVSVAWRWLAYGYIIASVVTEEKVTILLPDLGKEFLLFLAANLLKSLSLADFCLNSFQVPMITPNQPILIGCVIRKLADVQFAGTNADI